MNCRMFLILAMATGGSAIPGFAGDGPDAPSKTMSASGPTAAEFLPMTRSERFRNYLLGIADGESIVRAAASAGIRQAKNSPKEWQGGAEGYGYRVKNWYSIGILDREATSSAWRPAAVGRIPRSWDRNASQG